MKHPVLIVEREGPVAWLRLNRPEAMNALNAEVAILFGQFLSELSHDDGIRVVVVTGAGAAFCAGADLKEVQGSSAVEAEPGKPDLLNLFDEHIFSPLRDYAKPVIASLNGITMAGGLEVAMCADIVVAASGIRIGDAHANFGVFPGGGGAAILPRIVPHNVAKYLLLTGKTLSAEDMHRYGFVNEVVEPRKLRQATQDLALHIADKSPLALRRMKRVANRAVDGSRDQALAHEMVEFQQHQHSWDMAEGLAAFAGKRKPQFQGR